MSDNNETESDLMDSLDHQNQVSDTKIQLLCHRTMLLEAALELAVGDPTDQRVAVLRTAASEHLTNVHDLDVAPWALGVSEDCMRGKFAICEMPLDDLRELLIASATTAGAGASSRQMRALTDELGSSSITSQVKGSAKRPFSEEKEEHTQHHNAAITGMQPAAMFTDTPEFTNDFAEQHHMHRPIANPQFAGPRGPHPSVGDRSFAGTGYQAPPMMMMLPCPMHGGHDMQTIPPPQTLGCMQQNTQPYTSTYVMHHSEQGGVDARHLLEQFLHPFFFVSPCPRYSLIASRLVALLRELT